MKASLFSPTVTLTFAIQDPELRSFQQLEREILQADAGHSWYMEGRHARIRNIKLKLRDDTPAVFDPRLEAACSYQFDLSLTQLHAFEQYAETLARQLSLRLDDFRLGVRSVSFMVELKSNGAKTFRTLAARKHWAEIMKRSSNVTIDPNDPELFNL